MAVTEARIVVRAEDRASATLKSIGGALKSAEAQARAMTRAQGAGASTKLVDGLQRMGASAKQIDKVSASWKAYATAQGVAAGADRTKAQISAIRNWETATISSLRRVRREEEASAKSATSAANAAMAAARRRSDAIHHHGVVRTASTAAAGYVSAHAVAHATRETVQAGAKYQHEVVALQNSGRTKDELHEIEEESRKATRALPTATYKENLQVINETTSAFGSLHHAIENLPFMQKSASVLHAAAGDKIHDNAGELGNKLVRFFEERHVAGNTPQFQREAEGLVRAMAFTRGNFNPAEAMNFAQQAKSSLPNYSERFLTKIAPSLITMLKGDRAGTAANAFTNTIMGKARDAKQAEAWAKYGLLDTKQALMGKNGPVGWKAGAVKNTDLALSDPLEWVEKVMLPAMKKKGVKTQDRLELTKALATMFRNSNANVFANDLAQPASRTRLHKDEKLMEKAGKLDEIYKRNLGTDPTVAVTALTASLENLATVASSPAMATAASAITGVAKALNVVAEWGAETPKSAMAAGAGAAGLGFAGAGYMSYKLMTGFGLGTSATALTGSAAALDASAAALMRASAVHGVPGAASAAGAGASAGASAAGAGGAAAEAAARREAVRVTSTGGASVAAEGAGLGARLGRAAASALSLAGRGLRFGSGVATPLLMLRDIGEAAHPMNPESAAARVPGIAGVVNGRRTDPLDPGVLERARRSQVEMNHGFGFEAKRARDNAERMRARQLADDEVMATLTRAPGARMPAPGSGLRGFGLSGPQAGKAAPGAVAPLVDSSSLQGANAEAKKLTEALGAVEAPRKLALDGSALREVERDIDRVTAKFSALMGLAGAAPGQVGNPSRTSFSDT